MTHAEIAARLVGTCAAHGVTDAVVSPGSRSAPLVLALAKRPDVHVHVVTDERSAGFFALGLAKGTERPVILVCTSGSAGAHYYPAVIEAHESGVRLIVMTADRPARLQHCGAPQTTNQHELFGTHVTGFWHLEGGDPVAVAGAAMRVRGVAHINVAFDEPLHEEPVTYVADAIQPEPTPLPEETIVLEGEGIIVAGEGGSVSNDGIVVFADPLSNLRRDARAISTYDTFLRSPTNLQPDWVVRVGRPPTSKVLGQWLSTLDTKHVVVDPFDNRWDPYGCADVFVPAMPIFWSSSQKLSRRVRALERTTREELDRFVDGAALFEGTVIRALPPRAGVFAASSMPIRDLDTFLPSGTGRRVFANRGVNGIDGQISTAAGLAAAGVVQVALVGDVAALHDLTGLELARRFSLTVVVVQNDGGGIFEYLPISENDAYFEEFFVTPHGRRFREAAAMFGLEYEHVTDKDALECAQFTGPRLVEVEIPRARSVALHRDLWAPKRERPPRVAVRSA